MQHTSELLQFGLYELSFQSTCIPNKPYGFCLRKAPQKEKKGIGVTLSDSQTVVCYSSTTTSPNIDLHLYLSCTVYNIHMYSCWPYP